MIENYSLGSTQHPSEHFFAKSNPNYLSSMFGATDLKPFWLADMDFKVANPITEEILRLAERGNYSYEFKAGEVFKAISDWNKRRNNLELDSKAFIQVPGVLTGLALLMRELTNEGDGVLIQTPVYHQFAQLIKTAKRKIVENPLKIVEKEYMMDFDGLTRIFESDNVKVMILCNPHNPVGRVWKKEELQKLVDIANNYGVVILSDEIHSDIVYAPSQFNSIASLKDSTNHIAVIGSPAKSFGMQSISNGYLYIPNAKFYEQVKSTVGSMYLDHGNIFSTYATLAAYQNSEQWIDSLIDYLKDTVDWIEDFVGSNLPKLKMFKPEGTYQVWMDFSDLGFSEEELKQVITMKAKLALTPGSWFGGNHSQYMRMNIAAPLDEIQKAFKNLKNAIGGEVDTI